MNTRPIGFVRPVANPATPPSSNPNDWQVFRKTYDEHNKLDGPVTLVRSEGDAPVKDPIANAAHDAAKTVFDFYKDELGRNGIDGKGGEMDSVVHVLFDDGAGGTPDNAAWDGKEMQYGDGDGKTFGPFAYGLDVVGHELTHGVTEHTANLRYSGQSGALNESWSDVMGELVQLWHEDPSKFGDLQHTRDHDWVSGEDIYTPNIPGDAGRSFKAPGTANPDDDQPADMKHYVRGGDVHTNSGIPNHAAYLAAMQIGGDKLAKVWYRALTSYLKPSSDFSDAARSTVAAAKELYPNDPATAQAVQDAWTGVGVPLTGHTADLDKGVPATLASGHPELNDGWAAPYMLRTPR